MHHRKEIEKIIISKKRLAVNSPNQDLGNSCMRPAGQIEDLDQGFKVKQANKGNLRFQPRSHDQE